MLVRGAAFPSVAGFVTRSVAAASLAALVGCGNSAHYSSSPLSTDAAPQALGAPCSTPADCTSNFCLNLGANDQGVQGLCSEGCTTSAQCGPQGSCLPEHETIDGGPAPLDGGACFQLCSAASDCAAGIPCIWQSPFDAGFCETISPKGVLCGEYAEAGASSACEVCLAQSCCDEMAACVQDVPCAKLETCAGTCASSFQGSGIPAAVALGDCASSQCPSQCF